jgi:hypothetical protein
LHQKHRDHFRQNDDAVLVVQGTSKLFNPSLSDAVIAAQRAADPTAAGAEWDAEFRSDIAAFLDDELIDAAVEPGRPLELAPIDGFTYRAFTDGSGGVGADSYTVAIAHREAERLVLDVVRGTAGKFDPHEVTRQHAALCRKYRVREVIGDSYAQEWVAAAWRGTGIAYRKSELPKSQIYLECVPLFTRGCRTTRSWCASCVFSNDTRTAPARIPSTIRAALMTISPTRVVALCISSALPRRVSLVLAVTSGPASWPM